MPARRTKRAPTPWQRAKPFIETALGSALGARGFGSPAEAMTFWRRRGTFIDAVQLRSKYGTARDVYFGCHPAGVRESMPSEVHCMFRTSAGKEFSLATEDAAIRAWVERELVPSVSRVVDTWFLHFSSLESAFVLLENKTQEVAGYRKDSPAYESARLELIECIRRKAGGGR